MKKVLTIALCAAFMAGPLLADDYIADSCKGAEVGSVTTTDLKGHAAQITLSGGIDVDSVWRSSGLTAVLNRAGVRADEDPSESDSFWSPLVTLRLDATMARHVTGVIELQNHRLRSSMHLQKDAAGRRDLFEADNDFANGNAGWGSLANQDTIGGREIIPSVQQAYINVDEFLCSCLSMKVGVFNEVWDLRGNGNPFFMGLRTDGSDYAFISPVQEGFSAFGSRYAYSNIIGAAGRGVHRDSVRPGGMELWYKADDSLKLELFTLNILESDFMRDDEYAYGLRAIYNIHDSPSVLQSFFAVLSNRDNHNRVYNFGVGADYWMDRAEMFGEFVYQWGDYGDNGAVLDPAGGIGGLAGTIDQEAWAGYIGGRYNFDVQMHPYAELLYKYASGSDGDHDQDGDTNKNFVSYGNDRTLMILEDNLYGLGVKSNYWKVQFDGGVTTGICCDDDLRFRVVAAYSRLVSPPDRLDLTDVLPGRNLSKNLGTEVDAHLDWAYSDSLRFGIAGAWLGGGGFWNDPGGFGAGDRNDNGDATDTMWMVMIDANLRF